MDTKSSNNNNISINDSITILPGDNNDKNTNNKSNNGNLNILTLSKISGLNNNANAKGYFGNYKNYYNNKNDDTASVFSDTSRFTGYVSTIASCEYQLNNTLVAMIGISEYDGMPNLDGVVKDYENVIKTFSTHWKYNVLFQLKNKKYIYTNDIKQLQLNENKQYKLKWNGDDINAFLAVTRKHIVQQEHNGLIFVVSSHGDRDKIMYDSNCQKLYLDSLFSMYKPKGASLLESCCETEEESNNLSHIPKIFVLDMCRGKAKAKPVQIGQAQTQSKEQGQKVTKTTQNKHVSQETQLKEKDSEQ